MYASVVPVMALEVEASDLSQLDSEQMGVLLYDTVMVNREDITVQDIGWKSTIKGLESAIQLAREMKSGSYTIHREEDYSEHRLKLVLNNNYTYGELTDEQAQEVENKAKEIANEARESFPIDKVKQLRYVNQWLCNNNIYTLSKLGTTGNDAYGALIDGKPVCEGYALAVSLICDELGIPNITIYSDIIASGESHCYNEVYVNNEWKYLDVTWNDTDGDMWRYFLCDKPCKKYREYDKDKYEHMKIIKYPEIIPEQTEWLESEITKRNKHRGLIDNRGLSDYITRAELAQIVELLGRNNHKTIYTDKFVQYKDIGDLEIEVREAIEYCTQTGILTGHSKKEFRPYEEVSKETMCIVMNRILNVNDAEYNESIIEKAVDRGILSQYRTDKYRGKIVKLCDLIDTAYRVNKIIEESE